MNIDRHPPGPSGPGREIENLKRFQEDYEGFLRELVVTYGDIVLVPLGKQRICLLNDPEYIKQVFLIERHSFQKPEALRASNRGYWGDGLTSLEGAGWQRMRRLLQPAFHPRHFAQFAPVIVECARDMVASWQPGECVNVHQAILALVTRIAARTVLDAEIEEYAAADAQAARAGVIPAKEARGVQFPVTLLSGETGTIPMLRTRAGRRMSCTVGLIEERLASREQRGDMLSHLLHAAEQAGCALTANEVTGEMIQMLFAGHHTTPRAFDAIWSALAEHPEVELKLHAELDRVLRGRSPVADDLPNLPYGEMVIKEAMRAYIPSGPALHREVIRPVQVGGYTLEPGTLVWVDSHLLHHDPRYFVEPERFWPERFSKERAHRIPNYAFLAFGAGPRTCIGNGFAMMEIQLILTMVAQAYRLAFVPGAEERATTHMLAIAREHTERR